MLCFCHKETFLGPEFQHDISELPMCSTSVFDGLLGNKSQDRYVIILHAVHILFGQLTTTRISSRSNV